MSIHIQAQLLQILKNLMYNINKNEQVENLDLLLDHQFYFDVCPLIFPQFNIQIIKIGQERDLAPSDKLQALLNLLARKLDIDTSDISPIQVLKGHFFHMFKIMRLLNSFSEDQFNERNVMQGRKIDKHHSLPVIPQLEEIEPKSNSDKICSKLQQISNRSLQSSQLNLDENPAIPEATLNENQIKNNKIEDKNKRKKTNKKQQKKQKQEKKKINKKGFYECSYLGDRDKLRNYRKSNYKQNQQIKLANKKYKSYLQGNMKQNKPQKKRNSSLIRPKSAKIKTMYRDIQQIDNFFKSFECQLRDQKQKYLRRMQQIIRSEQNQRLWTNDKKIRQQAKAFDKKKEALLNKVNHIHCDHKQLIKQEAKNRREQIYLRKKQYQKSMRDKHREHRQKKKKETEQIKNKIQQINDKVLMKMEQGGHFQKMVMNLYKRY